MGQYVAFFRGLNVTGKNTIKMHDLKRLLESLGCHDVKTVLASGNALFTAPQDTPKTLQQKIETSLKEQYQCKGNVILRPYEKLVSLMETDPFKGIEITPKTRLYVTFLPYPVEEHPHTAEEHFSIIHTTPSEVFTVLSLAPDKGTADFMKVLDKAYGSSITTRNWNTILKMTTSR